MADKPNEKSGQQHGRDQNDYERQSRLTPRGKGEPGGVASEFAPDERLERPAGYQEFGRKRGYGTGYSELGDRPRDEPGTAKDRGADKVRR